MDNYNKLDKAEIGIVKVLGGFHNYDDRHLALKEYIAENYCSAYAYDIRTISQIMYPIIQKTNTYQELLYNMGEYVKYTSLSNTWDPKNTKPLDYYSILYIGLIATIPFIELSEFKKIGTTKKDFESVGSFVTYDPSKMKKIKINDEE